MHPETEEATAAAGGESGGDRVVRLSIPARPEYISLCRLALSGLAAVRPFAEEELADLKLALTEACSNSVRHAYRDGADGHVHIAYELGGSRIAIEVVDDGAGFDPAVEAAGARELSEGGLGIAIIRAIADEFALESREGSRGSRLRFAKVLGG